MITMKMLQMIIMACSMSYDAPKCYDTALNKYDEYFSKNLSNPKARTFGHIINEAIKESNKKSLIWCKQ